MKYKHEKKSNGPNKFLLGLGITALIILLFTTIGGMALALSTQETIVNGVTLEGVPLHGLTKQEAANYINDTAKKHIAKSTINLTYGQESWSIQPENINMSLNADEVLEEVYAPGHTGTMLQRLIDNLQCIYYGKNINFTVNYDPNALDEQLKLVAKDVYSEPVNAICYFGPNFSIEHSKAVIGKKINTEDLAATIEEQLLSLNIAEQIELEPIITQPYVTDNDVKDINSILASYSTHFSEYDYSRSQNVRLAAKAISGVIVKPNQVLSFNDTVGHRNAANGYKSAAVIINGKVEQDLGGGVCQVSSTLYNAILLAGLTSTERASHFFPSSYVPAGRDATVADGVLDFKFRNPLPHSVFLLTSCYNGTINVFVLGCKEDLQGKTYKIETNVKRGGSAPVVTVSRVAYKNGEEVGREVLHTDNYDEPND